MGKGSAKNSARSLSKEGAKPKEDGNSASSVSSTGERPLETPFEILKVRLYIAF